jgi:uncharacterized protein YdiU (UPF0061 family)
MTALLILFPPCAVASTLSVLGQHVDNEYIRVLEPDPEAALHAPNHAPRSVKSGHFVFVSPTPLTDPALVIASDDTCNLLGLAAEGNHSACDVDEDFIRLFSGHHIGIPGFAHSWAAPYALSIYGQEIVPNGAGVDGDGYGDGRAISIGEVALQADDETTVRRYELQLKGAGKTPFCRGADGRAVLRSSAREFLASEAMHALGVPTTRALSLIASGDERVSRPWYLNQSSAIAIGAHRPDRASGGDIMRRERTAITTRVSSSFLRVGQFELYGRRARSGSPLGLAQLRQLTLHAIRREYPSALLGGSAADGRPPSLQQQVLHMAREACGRFAHLAAEWLRVGYVQSNFNADNSLMGGATVDYGPFGFLEAYEAGWSMWIGGGQHFSFGNQPKAAGVNLRMLLRSLEPLLDAEGVAALRQIAHSYAAVSEAALAAMWARKLGFPIGLPSARRADGQSGGAAAAHGVAGPAQTALALWRRADALLGRHRTDWTLFWRQLSEVPSAASEPDAVLLDLLAPAFYGVPDEALRRGWARWLREWLKELGGAHGAAAFDGAAIGERMRRASPK